MQMWKKKLPIGVDHFEKLRREDFYYVDKTGMIAELLRGWGEVNLFARPRRFGKTLNMSMIKSFLEVGTDPALFNGLAIQQEEALCRDYMGQYPVVFVSLKGVDGRNFEDAYALMRKIIRNEMLRLEFLLESFFAAFETGKADVIEDVLNHQLLECISYYDAYESFYHGFLLALLSACPRWSVASNMETGRGRSDILVEGRDRKTGAAIEIKHVKSREKLTEGCEHALSQIEEKDYTAILRRYRYEEIRIYGIAFWDKECRVQTRQLR